MAESCGSQLVNGCSFIIERIRKYCGRDKITTCIIANEDECSNAPESKGEGETICSGFTSLSSAE